MNIIELLELLDGYGLVITDGDLIDVRLRELDIDPNERIEL